MSFFKWLTFGICLTAFTACASTITTPELPSRILQLPIDEAGQLSGPIRFISVSRAVDDCSSALWDAKVPRSDATLGRYTFNVPDSQLANYEGFEVDLTSTDSKTEEFARARLCALVNNQVVTPKIVCSASDSSVCLRAAFDCRGQLWQGTNTLILHSFDCVSGLRLVQTVDSVRTMTDIDLNGLDRAKSLPSFAYQWYCPHGAEQLNTGDWFNYHYRTWLDLTIKPVAFMPDWVSVLLNHNSPLMVYENIPETLELRKQIEQNIIRDEVESTADLNAIAIWYAMEFVLPENGNAPNEDYYLTLCALGSGAIWLNGEQCTLLPSTNGCQVVKIEAEKVKIGERNRLSICLLPATEGAILEAAQLQQGAPEIANP